MSGFHEEEESEAVEHHDEQLTQKDENRGKSVGPSESKSVRHIEQKSIPSRAAEVFTTDCHVSVGQFADVVTHFLNASEKAIADANDDFNGCIITACFFSLFSEVFENEPNELN